MPIVKAKRPAKRLRPKPKKTKIKSKILKVRNRLDKAKEAERGGKVKNLRGRVTKQLRSARTEKVAGVRQVIKGTPLAKTVKATTQVVQPSVRAAGNVARNTLAATRKRVQRTNFGISGQNPLG
jgi:hypothetical protein